VPGHRSQRAAKAARARHHIAVELDAVAPAVMLRRATRRSQVGPFACAE
jgi:hypothetical protein